MSPQEEPCPPVAAFRWVVFWGTCTAEVVAATKDDAVTLGVALARAPGRRYVKARRLRPSDDARRESWKQVAHQLGLSDRKAGLG